MARDTHVTINTIKRPEATMSILDEVNNNAFLEDSKKTAREHCFSVGVWASRTVPSRAAELFNEAYDYGFGNGQREGERLGRKEGEKVGYHAATLENAPFSKDVLVAATGYTALLDVLRQAHDQAAMGKGKERHANDKPFEQQRMLSIARTMKDPAASLAYQVSKKVTEGLQFDDPARTVVELLGAINYLAGMVILVQERPVPAATDAADCSAYDQLARDFADTEYKPCEGTQAHRVIEEIKALSPESAELVRQFFADKNRPEFWPSRSQ